MKEVNKKRKLYRIKIESDGYKKKYIPQSRCFIFFWSCFVENIFSDAYYLDSMSEAEKFIKAKKQQKVDKEATKYKYI